MTHIALYGKVTREQNPIAMNALTALYVGLRAAGYKVRVYDTGLYTPDQVDKVAELAVVAGGVANAGRIVNDHLGRGTPLFVLGPPVLEMLEVDAEDPFFGVYPGGNYVLPDIPAHESRWLRLPKVSPVAPCRPPTGDHVLILGQAPGDPRHGLFPREYDEWRRERESHWFDQDVPFRTLLPDACDEAIEEALRECVFADTLSSSREYLAYHYDVPCLRRGDEKPAVRQERLHVAAWMTYRRSELLETPDTIVDIVVQGPPAPPRKKNRNS